MNNLKVKVKKAKLDNETIRKMILLLVIVPLIMKYSFNYVVPTYFHGVPQLSYLGALSITFLLRTIRLSLFFTKSHTSTEEVPDDPILFTKGDLTNLEYGQSLHINGFSIVREVGDDDDELEEVWRVWRTTTEEEDQK